MKESKKEFSRITLFRARLIDASLFFPLPMIIIFPALFQIAAGLILIFSAIQIFLLTRYGQTIGLMHSNLKIVRRGTNEKPSPFDVFMRYGCGMVPLLRYLGISPGQLSCTEIVNKHALEHRQT